MFKIDIAIPDYAKDLRLNLSRVLTVDPASDLSTKQIMAIALAAAFSTRNNQLIEAMHVIAKRELSHAEYQACQIAVSLMGMNNIYYRFVHLVEDEEYRDLPVNLRMNAMANPGVDNVDFEMLSLAVSAINGCGMCIASHQKSLRTHSVSTNTIQHVIRIAAVIHGVAAALSVNVVNN